MASEDGDGQIHPVSAEKAVLSSQSMVCEHEPPCRYFWRPCGA